MADTVRVRGLREMQRAFAKADKTLSRELRDALREVAEPVRAEAEQLAVQRIRNVGMDWSRMRVGVSRTLVYVAPKQRGVKSKADRRRRRPNFADLLMDMAMVPALQNNVRLIERRMDDMLGKVGSAWERG